MRDADVSTTAWHYNRPESNLRCYKYRTRTDLAPSSFPINLTLSLSERERERERERLRFVFVEIGFPATKSLDQIRSLSGSAKNFSFSSRQSQDFVSSSGNFSNLKLTAEKMVKEQASMKSDLELALQIANDELAKLRESQKDEENMWSAIEKRLFRSTRVLLTDMAITAEKNKKMFESRFSDCSDSIVSLRQQVQDLSSKFAAINPMKLISEASEEEPEKLEAGADTEEMISKLKDAESERQADPGRKENDEKEQVDAETEPAISKLMDAENKMQELSSSESKEKLEADADTEEVISKLKDAESERPEAINWERLAHVVKTRGKKKNKPRICPLPQRQYVKPEKMEIINTRQV